MNRHNLPLAWHAATDMSAIGWVMIANGSDCLISPGWMASIAEDDSIINATLLYFTNNPCQINVLSRHMDQWRIQRNAHDAVRTH